MAVVDVAFNGIARLIGMVSGQETTRARIAARRGPELLGESLLVDRKPAELYAFWRQPENLPSVFPFLEKVQVLDAYRAAWTVRSPGGAAASVEWEARVVEDVADDRIAWRVASGVGIAHLVSVRFQPGPRGTGMRVELRREGVGNEAFFGEPTLTRVREGLRGFKRRMETGESLTTEGQPRGTCAGTRQISS